MGMSFRGAGTAFRQTARRRALRWSTAGISPGWLPGLPVSAGEQAGHETAELPEALVACRLRAPSG